MFSWIEWKKVFTNIPAGSVVVIDRATYHTKLTKDTTPASSSFTKLEFAKWLVEKGVKEKKMKTVEDYMSLTRVELACLCKQHRPKKRYEI